MSDGMSDARALDEMAGELEDAAMKFAQAIQRAEAGHRGIKVSVTTHVNDVLRSYAPGFRLVRESDNIR